MTESFQRILNYNLNYKSLIKLNTHPCNYAHLFSIQYQSNSVPVGWFTSLFGCSTVYSYPGHSSLFSLLTKLNCFPDKKKTKTKTHILPINFTRQKFGKKSLCSRLVAHHTEAPLPIISIKGLKAWIFQLYNNYTPEWYASLSQGHLHIWVSCPRPQQTCSDSGNCWKTNWSIHCSTH